MFKDTTVNQQKNASSLNRRLSSSSIIFIRPAMLPWLCIVGLSGTTGGSGTDASGDLGERGERCCADC